MCLVRLYILHKRLLVIVYLCCSNTFSGRYFRWFVHTLNNGKIGTARFGCVRVCAFKIFFRKPNCTCTTKIFYGLNWKMAICLSSSFVISKWHHRKFHDLHTHTERESIWNMRCIQQPSGISNIIVVRPNACIKSCSVCCVRFTCYNSKYEVNVVIISVWHSTFCPGLSLSSIMHNSILRMHKGRNKRRNVE